NINRNNKRILVRCTDKVAEFAVNSNGKKTNILVIDKDLALKSYVVTLNGKKSLIFSDAIILQNENSFELLSDSINSYTISIYPKNAIVPKASPGELVRNDGNSLFSSYRLTLTPFEFAVNTKQI